MYEALVGLLAWFGGSRALANTQIDVHIGGGAIEANGRAAQQGIPIPRDPEPGLIDALAKAEDDLAQVRRELLTLRRQQELFEWNEYSAQQTHNTLQMRLGSLQQENYNLRAELKKATDNNLILKNHNNTLQEDIRSLRKAANDHQQLSLTYAAEVAAEQKVLFNIRRRILADKTMVALERKYSLSLPRRQGETFNRWLRRVKYPRWKRIIAVVTNARNEGNKAAHQATLMQMQDTVDFARKDVNEGPEEADVLQEMLDICRIHVHDGWDAKINAPPADPHASLVPVPAPYSTATVTGGRSIEGHIAQRVPKRSGLALPRGAQALYKDRARRRNRGGRPMPTSCATANEEFTWEEFSEDG
ncbi:hypothetical protein H0H87_000803 [Tephrocybe sp. NHM501043]|nr:hypothetical protein H0H87_000803 [Tephrocybe sp. NHM501043]